MDLTTAPGHRNATLGVGQRRAAEQLRDALAALHLDEQRAPAPRSQRDRGSRRQGRLAGASLAGHHMQSGAGPVAGV